MALREIYHKQNPPNPLQKVLRALDVLFAHCSLPPTTQAGDDEEGPTEAEAMDVENEEDELYQPFVIPETEEEEEEEEEKGADSDMVSHNTGLSTFCIVLCMAL